MVSGGFTWEIGICGDNDRFDRFLSISLRRLRFFRRSWLETFGGEDCMICQYYILEGRIWDFDMRSIVRL